MPSSQGGACRIVTCFKYRCRLPASQPTREDRELRNEGLPIGHFQPRKADLPGRFRPATQRFHRRPASSTSNLASRPPRRQHRLVSDLPSAASPNKMIAQRAGTTVLRRGMAPLFFRFFLFLRVKHRFMAPRDQRKHKG